ncbi:conserved protein of unknown function [Moritella yayanosii]|uniref:Uncharacterized protein n=1 Tax=Moritella yayanosii TaxID=69539 RepID=A0A330LL56_9GAMM|nr:conserved protein of unknown function [Moritella yayanosii]
MSLVYPSCLKMHNQHLEVTWVYNKSYRDNEYFTEFMKLN